MVSPSKTRLVLATCIIMLGLSVVQVQVASAQDGALLRRFILPERVRHPEYFPVGMAFDDTNLWYSDPTDKDPDIFQVTINGALLRVLPLKLEAGALAWDGTHLWVASFEAEIDDLGGELFQVSVGENPAILKTIDLRPIFAPDAECGFIDGLDYDTETNTLWVSPDPGCAPGGDPRHGFVYNIDTNGNLIRKLEFPFGVSGVERVGKHLYVVQRTPAPLQIHRTTLRGTILSSFTTDLVTEDLAFDSVTFAPTCVLWANQRDPAFAFPLSKVDGLAAAYQIEC